MVRRADRKVCTKNTVDLDRRPEGGTATLRLKTVGEAAAGLDASSA